MPHNSIDARQRHVNELGKLPKKDAEAIRVAVLGIVNILGSLTEEQATTAIRMATEANNALPI